MLFSIAPASHFHGGNPERLSGQVAVHVIGGLFFDARLMTQERLTSLTQRRAVEGCMSKNRSV